MQIDGKIVVLKKLDGPDGGSTWDWLNIEQATPPQARADLWLIILIRASAQLEINFEPSLTMHMKFELKLSALEVHYKGSTFGYQKLRGEG